MPHRQAENLPDLQRGQRDLASRRSSHRAIDPHLLRTRLVAEQPPAIALDRRDLRPAAHQHQQDERTDEVEVHEPRVLREPAVDGSGVGTEDAQRNRQVDVEHAFADGPHRPAKKIAAAREETQRAEQHRESAEQPRIGERGLHAEVGRQREQQDVHREGSAKADALGEIAALGRRGGLGARRPNKVIEGLERPGEAGGVELAGLPFQPDATELGVDFDPERARLALKELFNEPDAADARDALQIQDHLRRSSATRRHRRAGWPHRHLRFPLQRLQPAIVARLEERAARGRDDLVL